MRSCHQILVLLCLVACWALLTAAQSIDAPSKAERPESRIIVRYAASRSETMPPLADRVKHLEAIPGVAKAEALPHLDMAVVSCGSQEGEESLLDALSGHDDVEMAVPDTWLRSFTDHPEGSDPSQCLAHPTCKTLGLSGDCCPTTDGVRLACCSQPSMQPGQGSNAKSLVREHGLSSIILHSNHGHYVSAYSNGYVALQSNMTEPHEDTKFFVVPHTDGTVSLKTRHGTYLVAMTSGVVATWHRGHALADDWEKFHLVYHQDGKVSLRSQATDMYVTADQPETGNPPGLTADKETVGSWEKFTVQVQHGSDTLIPNDSNFSKLWGMDHFGGRDIDAVEAWKTFTGNNSRGIVVAVIDTGIDYTHPDLKDRMWVNPNEIPNNGIDDDNNGIIDDVHGADFANNDGDPMDDQMHGTHCSGTIAGSGNNGVGVAGVSWQGVRLMALKFLSASGGGRTSDAIKAVNYAVAMGARLSSNSWGGGGSSSAMRVAIDRAEQAGMLFVAAAGNEASNNDRVGSYPGNYPSPSIISVASTTFKGRLSSFSNYGKSMVDVAAPGSTIFSSVPHGRYKSLSGTSMACPHVSGLAALIWLYRPQLSASQIKEIILKSAAPQHALKDTSLTDGLINARRALEFASDYKAPTPPVHGPRGLAFRDVDPRVGRVSGTITITAAIDESDVDYYNVHLLSTAGVMMHSVARVNATGTKELEFDLNGSLIIPLYARGFAVVAGNASAEAGIEYAATIAFEDYGVPEFGARGVSWSGDADGRVGFIAGALRLKRAENENDISHYNVYWRHGSERGELIGKLPGIGFMMPVCQGDCGLLNTSNTSGVLEYHRDAYGDNEHAVISFSGPARITVTSFLSEKLYDTLEIGSRVLSGTHVTLPLTVNLPAGPASITWKSDRSETQGGWTFQVEQLGEEGEIELPTMQPPSLTVEAVAAYHNYEGLGRVVGMIYDFDSTTMPPSAAFAPRAVQFEDINESQHIVAGMVEILPSQRPELKNTVTSYRLFVADFQGNQVGAMSWTVAAPANASAIVRMPFESMALPAEAVRFVARARSAVGESATSTSTEIIDMVRSAPLGVNFSGDIDPNEGIIRGNLTIHPAPDPTGIAAYAVYLANGTEKNNLLGRIAAPLQNKLAVFKVHAYYQEGLSLLAVSVYRDGFEMKSGAHAIVKDWISDAGEVRRLSEHQQDAGEQQSEPWLHRPRQPAWNEIQTLWTAQPVAKTAGGLPLLMAGRANPVDGERKVLGTLTIPGLLAAVIPLDDSEGEHLYMPMATEERLQLRDGLAEFLLSVGPEQVKLLRGQALKGDAAKAGAVRVTGSGRSLSSRIQKAFKRNPASLVVDFEVLPSATLVGADAKQDFLDRTEARLILLSQGGSAASRLDAILTRRFQGTGAALPEGGVCTLMSEPRQVAPKKQRFDDFAQDAALGRHLLEDRLVQDEVGPEAARANLAAVAAVALSAFGAVGCMLGVAIRQGKQMRQCNKEAVPLDSISVSDQ